MRRNLWKARCEKANAELSNAKQLFDLQGRMLETECADTARQATIIAGLCDALRATAELLEGREIHDTARHIRKIADNYSPALLAFKGEELRR